MYLRKKKLSSKKKSFDVKARVLISEETKVQINQLRLDYRPIAVRISIKFIVTCDMAVRLSQKKLRPKKFCSFLYSRQNQLIFIKKKS